MTRSSIARLTDIIEAIERLHALLDSVSVEAFEADWQRRWLAERGIEIISEASRHLSDELKARHAEIPWRKVAAIGNILRHDYAAVAAPIIWTLIRDNLNPLEIACRLELAQAMESG